MDKTGQPKFDNSVPYIPRFMNASNKIYVYNYLTTGIILCRPMVIL